MPQHLASLLGGGNSAAPSDASGLGIAEPNAIPGGIGDIDSLLRQLQSGQFSAEAILPLLLLLASGGLGGPPAGDASALPPGALNGDPLEAAFAGQAGPGQLPGGPPPDELEALLGGLGGGGGLGGFGGF